MQRHLFRKPAVVALGVIGVLFATALWAMFAPSHSDAIGGMLLLANAPVALPEMKSLIDNIQRTLAEFKTANDERLTKLEKGMPTGDIEAKMAKIQGDLAGALDLKATVEKMESKQNLMGLTGTTGEHQNADQVAYKNAFYNRFVRKGYDGEDLKALQAKAINITTGSDGAFAVPEVLDRTIDRLARDISAMRQMANVISISTGDYRKLVGLNGIGSGWVGEATARPATGTPTLAEITPFMGELYANPQVTQSALDDIYYDVEGDLTMQLVEEFAVSEGAAFFTGNGTNKPKGFLAYPNAATADGVRAFGTLQYIATGVAGDFAATNKADIFFDLIQSLKAGYRAGSVFTMPKALMFEVMKIKDSTGNYLWQPKLTDSGIGLNLLGFSVIEAEDMPTKAANSLSIAFGNFKRGYTIVDRIGTRMLRDPYSNKPYVGFYTTKRVGGMLVNSETIKLLKFGTS